MAIPVLPEIYFVNYFDNNGISAFTTFDNFEDHSEFVVLLRMNTHRDSEDLNHIFRARFYDFTFQCYKKGTKKEAALFFERVSDIVDEMFWDTDVLVEVTGGSPLPDLNSYHGFSLGVSISIEII